MAQPPSSPPGGRKSSSHGPPIGEDYGDFEGDPTSINQIPQPNAANSANSANSASSGNPGRSTPRAMAASQPPPPPQPQPQSQAQQPQMFSHGSPQLSHMGQPNAFANQTQMTSMMPGPPM